MLFHSQAKEGVGPRVLLDVAAGQFQHAVDRVLERGIYQGVRVAVDAVQLPSPQPSRVYGWAVERLGNQRWCSFVEADALSVAMATVQAGFVNSVCNKIRMEGLLIRQKIRAAKLLCRVLLMDARGHIFVESPPSDLFSAAMQTFDGLMKCSIRLLNHHDGNLGAEMRMVLKTSFITPTLRTLTQNFQRWAQTVLNTLPAFYYDMISMRDEEGIMQHILGYNLEVRLLPRRADTFYDAWDGMKILKRELVMNSTGAFSFIDTDVYSQFESVAVLPFRQVNFTSEINLYFGFRCIT